MSCCDSRLRVLGSDANSPTLRSWCAKAEDEHPYALFTYLLEELNGMGLAYVRPHSTQVFKCCACAGIAAM